MRVSPQVSGFDHFVRYPTRLVDAANLLERIDKREKIDVNGRILLEELYHDIYKLGGFEDDYTFRQKGPVEWQTWQNAIRPFKPEIVNPTIADVYHWGREELKNLFWVRMKMRNGSISRALRFVRALDAALQVEICKDRKCSQKTPSEDSDLRVLPITKSPTSPPADKPAPVEMVDPKTRNYLRAVRRGRAAQKAVAK